MTKRWLFSKEPVYLASLFNLVHSNVCDILYNLCTQQTCFKIFIFKNLYNESRYQSRRQDFFWGTPRPFKGYHVSPQGVRGAASRIVTKFKILKRIKLLENESFFQGFLHYSQKCIFQRKFQKLNIFYNDFWFSPKNYSKNFKFSIFMESHYISENFPTNSIIYFRNLSKHSRKLS